MIDAETRARFDAAVSQARRQGRDLAEVLDELSLLHTPVRQEAAAQQGLMDLWEAFERREASMFMQMFHGRTYGSPQDMHQAIAAWVQARITSGQVDLPRRRGGHRG